jgi:RNA-directed DNA polymerase
MTTGGAEGRDEISGAIPEDSGQKPCTAGAGASNVTGRIRRNWPESATGLMEKIVSRDNMMVAYSRVMSNKGAAGVDNMPVTALKGYLQGEWSRIKEELLGGAIFHNRYGK